MRTADPAKVRRIIDAAVQLFAERPYHEVRMEDIAARAQVAKGTLYLHYKDKEDLFLGILNDGLRSLLERIEASLGEQMSPEEKLLVMNRETFCYFEQNHFFLDVIQRIEFLRFGARSVCFEETRDRLEGLLVRVLREFPSLAKAPDEDLALMVLARSGMMKEILHSLPRPWPEDLPERVTQLFLHGLGVGRRGRGRRIGRR
ncbi:MAG: TetR/AcrR family transcriptional regulator [Planctomycetaceae bacterium]|nr:TetR/AcrR family transcriptional regulator [Planctomycetaceae bacterium]